LFRAVLLSSCLRLLMADFWCGNTTSMVSKGTAEPGSGTFTCDWEYTIA
jgi:hypothetical protein